MNIKDKSELSCFLIKASLDHRDMLRAVHLCEKDLYRPGTDLDNAISRYLQWLSNLHKTTSIFHDSASKSHQETCNIPPIDVAWIWHVHKLDPISYGKDCHRWFGRILDVPDEMNPFSHSQTEDLGSQTDCVAASFDNSEFHSKIVLRAAMQAEFLWQVCVGFETDVKCCTPIVLFRGFSFA